MARALALVIVWGWARLLILKRFFFPRPAIRRRCRTCNRRLREGIADRSTPGYCRKCVRKIIVRSRTKIVRT